MSASDDLSDQSIQQVQETPQNEPIESVKSVKSVESAESESHFSRCNSSDSTEETMAKVFRKFGSDCEESKSSKSSESKWTDWSDVSDESDESGPRTRSKINEKLKKCFRTESPELEIDKRYLFSDDHRSDCSGSFRSDSRSSGKSSNRPSDRPSSEYSIRTTQVSNCERIIEEIAESNLALATIISDYKKKHENMHNSIHYIAACNNMLANSLLRELDQTVL